MSDLLHASSALHQPLRLPCGVVIPNRLAKAAMTERLTKADGHPNEKHFRLYKKWASGDPGLLLTGNMMVDRTSLESAGNLLADKDDVIPKLAELARAAGAPAQQVWVQLNHPGRQTSRFINAKPVSASATGLKKMEFFAKARMLSEKEIVSLIKRFSDASARIKQAGFTGVQIHSAHGYLLSQFLSPLTNHRHDRWGGTLENRSRLLLEIVREVRKRCGDDFPVSVKLNSADFQRGGFEEDDAIQVALMLEKENIDLLEISGGNYENLVFFQTDKEAKRDSTVQREAYFMNFASRLRDKSKLAIMLTGGFRSRKGVLHALESGAVDMVGMARAFLTVSDFATGFLSGKIQEVDIPSIRFGPKNISDMAEGGFWDYQIEQIACGKEPNLSLNPLRSIKQLLEREIIGSWRLKRDRNS